MPSIYSQAPALAMLELSSQLQNTNFIYFLAICQRMYSEISYFAFDGLSCAYYLILCRCEVVRESCNYRRAARRGKFWSDCKLVWRDSLYASSAQHRRWKETALSVAAGVFQPTLYDCLLVHLEIIRVCHCCFHLTLLRPPQYPV